MNISIQFSLNKNLYIRNPQETKLGRKIIENSIFLLHEIGYEAFTFKKLAAKIDSTEASMYRYFENKHKLLLFLTSWYWFWLRFKIDFNSKNVTDAQQLLDIILRILSESTSKDLEVEYVDERLLNEIMIVEGWKAYHLKEVDEENEQGMYVHFKELSQKIAEVILQINPDYPYANTTATTLIEMAFNQSYYSEHLPRLSNLNHKNKQSEVYNMLHFYCEKLFLKI